VIEKQIEILDEFPFNLDARKILFWMNNGGDSRHWDDIVHKLIDKVQLLARPKAMYKVSRVSLLEPGGMQIDGIEFKGSMLVVNLRQDMIVYPFVATCGREVEEVKIETSDFIHKYALDAIKTSLAISAADYARDYILQKSKLSQISTMNPGELESWPLSQQRPLFELLGDVESAIGVHLTKNLGMIPLKSRSGIFFPSEIRFENCQFCIRQRCIGRRAAFDPELVKKYKTQTKGICG
jgi:hypothetical protein